MDSWFGKDSKQNWKQSVMNTVSEKLQKTKMRNGTGGSILDTFFWKVQNLVAGLT